MNTIYYYPHPPHTSSVVDYDKHPLTDLLYDLEPINPPHTKFQSQMDICPAMKIHRNHTFLIRSPIDIDLLFDKNQGWSANQTTQEVFDLITPPDSPTNPYLQLKIYYLFWSEKKTNDQLWMHDIPLHEVKTKPPFYIASGMIPIGQYTRNTSLGIVLNENESLVKIKRGQPLASITLVSDQGVKLVKKKPTQDIIDLNLKHFQTPRFCPYYATKNFFSKWLS